VQQNDQRGITIAGLDVMQTHIADLGVALPKLDPDVREQTRRGHEDLLGRVLGARLRLSDWISKSSVAALTRTHVSGGHSRTVSV